MKGRCLSLFQTCIWVVLGLALLPGSIGAQATFGTIIGRVVDATGAVVPGTHIKVTNQATNIIKAVVSNELGNYEATHLNPGLYTITAEVTGFKRFEHREVLLEALATLRIDIRLELGQVTTEVTVTAGTPVVESETATISQVRTNRQLLDMPLNIRTAAPLYQWTVLTPTANEGGGSLRTFAGGRGTQSFFNVDGISSNSIVFGNQESMLQPPVESMHEVRVEYVNNKAEFADAGNLTVVTKSGQNDFHGSAFWYHFNSALEARNFFATTRGAVDPATGEEVLTHQNNWGGSLGGPIRRDKAFFFIAYENNFDPTPAVVSVNVPTLKMRQGDFSDLLALPKPIIVKNPFTGQPFTGNIIPRQLLNASSLKAQERLYPLPNYGPPDLTTANFRGSFPRDRRIDKVNARIDLHFSEKLTVYARASFTRSLANELAGGFLPAEFVGGHGETLNRAPQALVSANGLSLRT